MSLGDIAKELELAPSTVHRIIRTLWVHGMVQQERDSKHYRLSPATLRLGNIYLDTHELRARVSAWTEQLARDTACAFDADGNAEDLVCDRALDSMTGKIIKDHVALRTQLNSVRAYGLVAATTTVCKVG